MRRLLFHVSAARAVYVIAPLALSMSLVQGGPIIAAASPAQVATIAGDHWTALPPPMSRDGHTAIYDPVRKRMLVYGGRFFGVQLSDVWELSLEGPMVWKAIAPAGTAPPARYEHSAIYDPVGDRMLVFGGVVPGGAYLKDVWELSLAGIPTWTQLAPTGTPSVGGQGHSAIYDPLRHRMVVFGGFPGSLPRRNDVWALSLTGAPAWSQLLPVGTPPLGREHHTSIYDPVRDRMVVFGGFDDTYSDDLWQLTLGDTPTWTLLSPFGPQGRFGHTAIHDAARDRMLIFGGRGGPSLCLDDAWELPLSGVAWFAVDPGGTHPVGRVQHAAVRDPVGDRMLVLGGMLCVQQGGGPATSDLWSLPLVAAGAWTAEEPAGPPPGVRSEHAAIHDPTRRHMVVFGGWDGAGALNDCLTLDLQDDAWATLTPSGSAPSARSGHGAIYHPGSDRMVVFGGYDGSRLNDVWTLSFAGSPEWAPLFPGGTPPTGRNYHSVIYDPVRDRMLVFGGNDGTRRNDVHALTLGNEPSWSLIVPTGTPPSPRFGHSAIYDPVRDRMLVFGGDGNGLRNDVWELTLSGSPAWNVIAPTGTPPIGRLYHSAVYDPLLDRMLVFGAYPAIGGGGPPWALWFRGANPLWTQLAPAGSAAPGRYQHSAIYDPDRHRMVVFGGQPGPRNDAWALVLDVPVGVPPPGPELTAPRIALVRPNPSAGPVTFELDVPGRGRPRSLTVYDVRGARVWSTDFTWEGADHASALRALVIWDGRRHDGTRVPAGLYIARLDGASTTAPARFAMLR